MSRVLLESAISGRNVVEFDAQGCRCVGEPHLLGMSHNDIEQTEIFQTGGDSRQGKTEPPGWRRFNVDAIEGVVVTSETFTPRPDFNPKSPYWYRVLRSV